MRIRLVVIVWLFEYPLSSFCAADGIYLNCLCSFCCELFPFLFASTYAYFRYDICRFLHLKTVKHCYNCVIAGQTSGSFLNRCEAFASWFARYQRFFLLFSFFSDGVTGEPSTTLD
jgi:hypothetical protein